MAQVTYGSPLTDVIVTEVSGTPILVMYSVVTSLQTGSSAAAAGVTARG